MSTIDQQAAVYRNSETARCLYQAEVALHLALASRVEVCVTAAARRLHDAISAHLAALPSDNTTGRRP